MEKSLFCCRNQKGSYWEGVPAQELGDLRPLPPQFHDSKLFRMGSALPPPDTLPAHASDPAASDALQSSGYQGMGWKQRARPDPPSPPTGSNLLTGAEGLLAKERESLKRLKCLRRYRQRYGVEALLHRQLRERRALASDGAAQQVRTALPPLPVPARPLEQPRCSPEPLGPALVKASPRCLQQGSSVGLGKVPLNEIQRGMGQREPGGKCSIGW